MSSGLVFPNFAIALGSVYLVARVFYTLGYKSSPQGRMLAAPVVNASLILLIIASIAASVSMTMSVHGLAPLI
jgi:hypothetical protein